MDTVQWHPFVFKQLDSRHGSISLMIYNNNNNNSPATMSGNNNPGPSRLPSATGHRASPYGERLPFQPPTSRPASSASSHDSILPSLFELRSFYDTTRQTLAEGSFLPPDILPHLSDWGLRSLSTSDSILLPLTCAALHMVGG